MTTATPLKFDIRHDGRYVAFWHECEVLESPL